MPTAIATIEYGPEKVALLKRTICKGSTDDELLLFVSQCQRTGLDPFARQIHAVKRWDSQQNREVMSIQTGIDGFRLIADRTGLYAGSDEPKYDREDAANPNKATVTVWKIVGGQRVAFTRSARWAEFVQTKKDGKPTRFWERMPYLMLGKVAEALALRTAFPQELSGLYTHEEMQQAGDVAIDVTPVTEPPKTPPTPVKPEPTKIDLRAQIDGANGVEPKPAKVNPVLDGYIDSARDAYAAAKSLTELHTAWDRQTPEIQEHTLAAKDMAKLRLTGKQLAASA